MGDTAKERNSIAPLVAGVAGGASSTIALYPLDLIKVRLAVNEGQVRSSSSTASSTKNPAKRLSSWQVVRTVIRHEGALGLYAGLSPAVIGSAVSWGGYFFIYEDVRHRYAHWRYDTIESNNYKEKLTALDNFGLACFSGAIMVGLTNPIWLIKTRMQLQMKTAASHVEGATKDPYKGVLHAARTIVREEGFLSLYKGAGAALLLTTHGGVQFMAYEFLRKHFHFTFTKAKRDPNKTLMERFQLSTGYLTMGAISKIIASTVTYPLQVIKARLQQRSETLELTTSGEIEVVKRNYDGILKAVAKIYRNEGFVGFFKGCIPNALRVAPGAAITFLVLETVLDMIDYNY
mmetsp:Transcript_52821/g.78918  ORF Transcript_52821/g.78918 Transcript_52821/m.78918 type:complete len:347 (-) Transcript_52821:154-1194(-)|eukprot:CAMPEP_0194058026 /NCGR_PEP_ID=MMETSP0009_2-20130614/65003_1 /TAXON_ID=210454 /ORGANISM="Grammatophora oceanica, Strain CCMP 410" /LENGTH=346 /DNA_ID=CAMNT_0038708007 /DNA_START=28 /DNA_END=1068 /DNA_ORIENTATION=+